MSILIQIVGAPFSGKTVSSCTFPKPMKFIDFDAGFESVKHAKDKSGNLIVPDWEKIEVIPMRAEKIHALEFSSPGKDDFKSGSFPQYTKESIGILSKYNAELDKINAGAPGQTKALVIDSASTMFRLWDEAIMFTNKIPGIRIGDYKTLTGILFGQWLPTLKLIAHTKVDWVIVINHEMTDKDELTGMINEFPVGPSANMGRLLSKEFDIVWRQKIEGDSYVWKTKPSGLFQGVGSRIGSLPDPIKPATFQELSKYL